MSYPLTYTVDYPERLSRGWVLLKVFFGWFYVWLPHGIILYFYGIVASIITFIAFWVILFTGKYPRGMFDVVVGYLRWQNNVNAYFTYLLRDEYPPFSNEKTAGYPVTLDVAYPEKVSRGLVVLKVLLGWLYVGIPHGIILGLYGFVVGIVVFITFWAILFAERYPRGMFDFVVDYARWTNNVTAYLSFLRDEYPPFSGRE